MTSQGKECKCCFELKPLLDFYRCAAKPDGYDYACKICKREKNAVYNAAYRGKHPQRVAGQKKNYRDSHKEKIEIYNRQYETERYWSCPEFRLGKVLRSRFRSALIGTSKSTSAIKDLGCTVEQLKYHLESLFQSGMTWANYGYRGWHIDHIKPLCSFDLSDPEQSKVALHYTNLRPLWWYENLSKGGRE